MSRIEDRLGLKVRHCLRCGEPTSQSLCVDCVDER